MNEFRYEVKLPSFDKTGSKLILTEVTRKLENVFVYTKRTITRPIQVHTASVSAFIRVLLTTVKILNCIIVNYKILAVR